MALIDPFGFRLCADDIRAVFAFAQLAGHAIEAFINLPRHRPVRRDCRAARRQIDERGADP
jgi:hypothetical protein